MQTQKYEEYVLSVNALKRVRISSLQFAICKAFRQFVILAFFLKLAKLFIELVIYQVILSQVNTPCWITTL